ncbi:imidazole glycerol phosphate synthase subunit HisH [Hyphococcus sp. DH-69]|uniref:imidazole glycerol phosphate synthase subunit HisH n=1 Tax=Hyphococcus formosus TaxID=3143534 RepID=UPI00398B4057
MAETLAIIDYGSGNLRSVEKAVERAAREAGLARHISVTDDPDIIGNADRLLLPGVGAFAACMAGLRARKGVLEAIEHAALVEHRPFLGICVGMQLLASKGLEFGESPGLDWVPGVVAPFEPTTEHRSPHMGWNKVHSISHHPVFEGLDGEVFYFAHSFHFDVENEAHKLCVAEHGIEISAVIGRDNILGCQFHPEKSQRAGLAFLSNFLTWSPS